MGRRCTLVRAQAKCLLQVNYCIIDCRKQVGDDVQSVTSDIIDSFQKIIIFHFFFLGKLMPSTPAPIGDFRNWRRSVLRFFLLSSHDLLIF